MQKTQLKKLETFEDIIFDKLEPCEKIKVDDILFKIPTKSCKRSL